MANNINNPDYDTDAARTVDQWAEFTVEVLKLKCNLYNLPTQGLKLTLCGRLFEYFHPQDSTESDDGIASDDNNEPEPDHEPEAPPPNAFVDFNGDDIPLDYGTDGDDAEMNFNNHDQIQINEQQQPPDSEEDAVPHEDEQNGRSNNTGTEMDAAAALSTLLNEIKDLRQHVTAIEDRQRRNDADNAYRSRRRNDNGASNNNSNSNNNNNNPTRKRSRSKAPSTVPPKKSNNHHTPSSTRDTIRGVRGVRLCMSVSTRMNY
jgi:hypothetical protein